MTPLANHCKSFQASINYNQRRIQAKSEAVMLQVFSWVLVWFVSGILVPIIGWFLFIIFYLLLVVMGSKKRGAKAQNKLRDILMRDEQIIASSMQKRVAALFRRRKFIAITTSRIISITRPLFGGFTMRDQQWKDLRDAQLEENTFPNIFGSKIIFLFGGAIAPLKINGIPNDVASQIYAHSQSEEQAWEEKRRVRSLEETRAASGGTFITTGQPSTPSNGGISIMDELSKAKALFDSEAINDSEYQELKAKIIGRQGQI